MSYQVYPDITELKIMNETDPEPETVPLQSFEDRNADIIIDEVPDVQPSEKTGKNSLYFEDGVRKIDFILIYSDSPSKMDKFREFFEKNLEEDGLELEKQCDNKTVYVKVHAPWNVLTRVAEMIPLKMPISKCDIEEYKNWCLAGCMNPLALDRDLVPDLPDFFMADFSREREKMFLIKDKNTFFSNSQRNLIVNELLLRTRYHPDIENKFGIDKLIRLGVYNAAFPLHDGSHRSEHSILTTGPLNDRHLLYEMWASPKRWYNLQPLDNIRKYFGEKVAIYFAWLGYYTYMLFVAAFVGIIVFVYGLATLHTNTPSEEICDRNGPGNITMCPLCDRNCTYWLLWNNCSYARLTYVFDNYATVFYAGFIAIWSTIFLELWKRQEAVHRYYWDMPSLDELERIRPEYEVKVKNRRKNPVTQTEEPYLPWYSKASRMCTSLSVVLFMTCCVLGTLFGVIMYRIVVLSFLYIANDAILRHNAKIITTITSALICVVVITLLNIVYEKIAYWLTDLEYQRTDSAYENSFILKMFIFQFINYYASIFYIAFFKGRFGGHPGNYDYRLGFRAEECDPAGCLIELCIQLAIIMIGKQAVNNFQEVMLPKIMIWYRARKSDHKTPDRSNCPQWESDNNLEPYPFMGLYEEYLEMVIQYGFITIFVAAFPLAPLFALINNIIEIRLDAYKLIVQWKRPVSATARDIGIWFGILKGITFIAIISNAFIIAWTSDFIPKMVYKFTVSKSHGLEGYVDNSLSYFNVSDFQSQSHPYVNSEDDNGIVTICRYSDYRHAPWSENKYRFTSMHWHVFCARLAFVIVFEHCVFFLTWLVSYLIPDVPGRIRLLMDRELHIAKEARYAVAFNVLQKKQGKSSDPHGSQSDVHHITSPAAN